MNVTKTKYDQIRDGVIAFAMYHIATWALIGLSILYGVLFSVSHETEMTPMGTFLPWAHLIGMLSWSLVAAVYSKELNRWTWVTFATFVVMWFVGIVLSGSIALATIT